MSDKEKHLQDKKSDLVLRDICIDWQRQITVKFYTATSHVFTQAFPASAKIREMKESLMELFKIPYDCLVLLYQDDFLDEHEKLGRLETDAFDILVMKLLTNDDKYAINVDTPYKDLTVPDIITVKVETDGDIKDVVVEIENRIMTKPYLGGYRNIRTGVRYLHGYTQTGPPKPKIPPEEKSNRDTQTYFTRNRRIEMEYSRATQMSKCDLYIPNINDRILNPGPYETADEREKRLDIEGKVRTIQRYYRCWKIRKCIRELSDEYKKRARMENEREEAEFRDDEARKRRDLVSKVFPMTLADFAMLYTMMERWKKSEIERISSVHCGPSKIAEFYLLLEKEIEILRSLENLRHKVINNNEVKKVLDFFKSIGTPIDWFSNYKELHIEMDTLETQKGRQYFSLYKALCDKSLNTEDRLKVYTEIKMYLKDHACHESEVITRLIERVCQLLARGMDENNLKGLEKRIEAMVLHHFKLTECNEGVTRHMRLAREKKMEKNLVFCPRCQLFKTIDAFNLTARMEKVKICATCKWLDKAEEPWIDVLPYRFILKQIRNYERLHRATTSVAFILQEKDVHHIINYIWHGHSALSECNDVYNLRLCRWNTKEEWSPWNCILLTVDEAKAHLKIVDMREVYEEEFISTVFNKHALAKKHFTQLMKYDKHFTEMAKEDRRLHEDSDYYNRPKPDCLFDITD